MSSATKNKDEVLISKYVTYGMVVRSHTAKKHGIINDIKPELLNNAKDLSVNIYDKIVDNCTKKKIKPLITNFYRCAELNALLKGSNNSQHLFGKAMDLDCDGIIGISNKMVFDFIMNNLEFDQLIWEFGNAANPDWVHVSYDKNSNRKQILVASLDNNITKYLPLTGTKLA